jgi:D-sedoheptulose 7-phosphate isomerase
MTMQEIFRKTIAEDLGGALSVHQAMLEDAELHDQLAELAESCLHTLRRGGKILFAGNGGSFADAQHLAAEFVSRLRFDRAPLPSIALATNSSSMSAIGNDYGYDQIFARELRALAGPDDFFIPITTSGNSQNILVAVEVARELSVQSTGFTGQSGGKLATACPCLRVPSLRTERIQEGQILLGHILCGLVEHAYFKGESR